MQGKIIATLKSVLRNKDQFDLNHFAHTVLNRTVLSHRIMEYEYILHPFQHMLNEIKIGNTKRKGAK